MSQFSRLFGVWRKREKLFFCHEKRQLRRSPQTKTKKSDRDSLKLLRQRRHSRAGVNKALRAPYPAARHPVIGWDAQQWSAMPKIERRNKENESMAATWLAAQPVIAQHLATLSQQCASVKRPCCHATAGGRSENGAGWISCFGGGRSRRQTSSMPCILFIYFMHDHFPDWFRGAGVARNQNGQ